MTRRRLDRITCTLPRDLVQAADRIARAEGRSRSWVVAEALRHHLARGSQPPSPASAVREEVVQPYAAVPVAGLDHAQLESDLRLTPEQRVHAVEESVRMALRLHKPPKVQRLMAFDSYDDYLDWKRREVVW